MKVSCPPTSRRVDDENKSTERGGTSSMTHQPSDGRRAYSWARMTFNGKQFHFNRHSNDFHRVEIASRPSNWHFHLFLSRHWSIDRRLATDRDRMDQWMVDCSLHRSNSWRKREFNMTASPKVTNFFFFFSKYEEMNPTFVSLSVSLPSVSMTSETNRNSPGKPVTVHILRQWGKKRSEERWSRRSFRVQFIECSDHSQSTEWWSLTDSSERVNESDPSFNTWSSSSILDLV